MCVIGLLMGSCWCHENAHRPPQPCHVSNNTRHNKTHTVHQTFMLPLIALAPSPCSCSSVPTPTRRDNRKWRLAQQSHARLAIAARACQFEPWPAVAAPRAALTRASPAAFESSWLVKSPGGKASRSEKRSATFRGAPRWIIQTVPVVTISAEMFSHLWTHTRTVC